MERLTRKSQNSDMVWFVDHENNNMNLEPCEMNPHHNRLAIQKLADYEEAEEQGLLREVPLKIGDVAWAIRNYNGVRRAQKGFVREMFYTQDMRLCIAVDRVARGEFGKKIFRTQEEAEAAMGRGM